MAKIIEVCSREKIPFAAQFSIGQATGEGESRFCTSAMTFGDEQINKAFSVMKPQKPDFFSFAISGYQKE